MTGRHKVLDWGGFCLRKYRRCYACVTFTNGRGNSVTVTPCRLFASLIAVFAPAVPSWADTLAASRVIAISIRAGLWGRSGYFCTCPAPDKGGVTVSPFDKLRVSL